LCSTVGWLDEGTQTLEYGKNHEGYWTGELFVKQVSVITGIITLEPLNCVTIQHSSVPPIPEHLAEQFSRCACGRMLDLYIGYDKRLIAETS
jgi:hypothetical protein